MANSASAGVDAPTDEADRPLLADTLGSDILPLTLALRPLPTRGEQKAAGAEPRPGIAAADNGADRIRSRGKPAGWAWTSSPAIDPGILEGCRIPTGPPSPIAS